MKKNSYMNIRQLPPESIISVKALSSTVLVVALRGLFPEWAAYIGAVPGDDHSEEKKYVAAHGTKISLDLAQFLFPHLDPQRYRG